MTDRQRAVSGFLFGFGVMTAVVQVFVVNSFDFENMQHGTRLLWLGVNPWAMTPHLPHFYNPPFSMLFLWPMLFLTPKWMLAIGGACLFSAAFYQKAWVALAWFLTNSALYVIAAGGIDAFVIGGGLLLLFASDRCVNQWMVVLLRVLGYGLLLTKPQGTIFIVLLFVILRRDWKGVLASLVCYGIPFIGLYPAWLKVILTDPPLSQTIAAHTIWGKFGLLAAVLVACLVILARRWRFWDLGGALAGILSPYGMPGLPIFLTLGAVPKLAAIPAVVLFSAGLAAMTWITPPPGVDFYATLNPLMSIYHIGMLGLALSLACISVLPDPIAIPEKIIDFRAWLIQFTRRSQPSTDEGGSANLSSGN